MSFDEIKRAVERLFLGRPLPITSKGYFNAVECVTTFLCEKRANGDIVPATELYDRIEKRFKLEKGVVNKRLLDFVKQAWRLFPEYFADKPKPYHFIVKIASELDVVLA